MKYFVTYCVMDKSIANPLWHACLLSSQWGGDDQKVEVTKAWGYYPMPTTDPNSLVGKVKAKIGFKTDLQDNHGTLKMEEMRWLDLGHGLHGITFEITKLQNDYLNELCTTEMQTEECAIKEARESLKETNTNPTSYDLYLEEKRKAREEQRASRLLPFDFRPTTTAKGVSLKEKSYTCKTRSLDLLRAIGIPEDQLAQLTTRRAWFEGPKSASLPIWSGNLEKIYLHSEGPRSAHISERTGKKTLFRTWSDKTKLYWTFPPQLIVKPKDPFLLQTYYANTIKSLIQKLQKIEFIAVNNEVDPKRASSKQKFIDYICTLYRGFSKLTSESTSVEIENKIEQAKLFLNALNFAINDHWVDRAAIETAVTYLPKAAQKEICIILSGLDTTPIYNYLPQRVIDTVGNMLYEEKSHEEDSFESIYPSSGDEADFFDLDEGKGSPALSYKKNV